MSKPVIKHRDGDEYLVATYKGHEISITRDEEIGDFYIQVYNDSGYSYDGWWDDSKTATLDDALNEAIDGAMLDNPSTQSDETVKD